LKKGLALNCPNLFFLQQFGDFKTLNFRKKKKARAARAQRAKIPFFGVHLV